MLAETEKLDSLGWVPWFLYLVFIHWWNRTEQNLVAWTLGVIACRWDTEQITPKCESLQCPLVRGRHSVYFWLQRSKNTRGHLPYTGGSAMPALCLTEKRTQLSREPIPWLIINGVKIKTQYINWGWGPHTLTYSLTMVNSRDVPDICHKYTINIPEMH